MDSIRKRLGKSLSIAEHPIRSYITNSLFEKAGSQSLENTSSSQNEEKKNFQDKYQVLHQIGQGAHGVIKKCISKDKKQTFAVKLMRFDDQLRYLQRKNFMVMKGLKHQNIVKHKALYLNRSNRTSYLVMEYVDCPNLKGYQVKNQAQLKHIIKQIVKALQYLHSKKICHRDLKTENILYSPETGKIKIVDFGICRQIAAKQQLLQMMTPTGTLGYKAPQMFNGQIYDQKVDIWALGVIMYELASKQNPFMQESAQQTQSNIKNLEINFNLKCWQNYSKVCKDLICRLLKKNKDQRLSTEQLANHLFFQEKSLRKSNKFQRCSKTIEKKNWENDFSARLPRKLKGSKDESIEPSSSTRSSPPLNIFQSEDEGIIQI